MGSGGVEMADLQMPKSASADSQPGISARSSTGGRDGGDRVLSHGRASTSPRCGFRWVARCLEEALEERRKEANEECIDEFNDDHYSSHVMEIGQPFIRHVIGVKGRMLHKIEDFCGIFIVVGDCEDGLCELTLIGAPSACILGEFIIDMLGYGYYSIIGTLERLGW